MAVSNTPQFKVGDKVRVKRGSLPDHKSCMLFGRVAKIHSINGNIIELIDGSTVHTPCGTWTPEGLELVESPTIESHDEGGEKNMAQTTFNIGDMVRIVADTSSHDYKIGSIYEISDIYDDNAVAEKVKYNVRGHGSYIRFADAELVSAKGNMILKELTKGQKTLPAGTQALLRAGYIDDKLELTPEGRMYLSDMLFRDNQISMENEVINEITEQEKAEAKKKKA